MFINAAELPEATRLEADLCIVGAGAAGITIARELIGSGHKVILLESGSEAFDPATQALYAAHSVGRPFQDTETSRLRFFGGSTNHWSGWCLPLDPIDFEPRLGPTHPGWPFPRAELDPFYARAQSVVQLGRYNYSLPDWGMRQDRTPAPFNGQLFTMRMLQMSPPTRFGETYGSALRQADTIKVCFGANLLGLDTDAAGARVTQARAATLGGRHMTVAARHFVLATGGLENARLLLLGAAPEGASGSVQLGNAHDLVGRTLMVHLEYQPGVIAVPDPYTDFSFYTTGGQPDAAGHRIQTFVSLTADALRRLNLPNFKLRWIYEYEPGEQTIRAVNRLAHLSSPSPMADARIALSDPATVAALYWRKFRGRAPDPVHALQLHVSTEPRPMRDSRILLGDDRDALGLRRMRIDWRTSDADLDAAVATLKLLGSELGASGFGRLHAPMLDGPPAWPPGFYGDEHHMGTTRMHADPTQGVVDADCRVHGTANLHVAGSSVFPTAGAANPTLTIVALALRLADKLKRELA